MIGLSDAFCVWSTNPFEIELAIWALMLDFCASIIQCIIFVFLYPTELLPLIWEEAALDSLKKLFAFIQYIILLLSLLLLSLIK